MPSPLSASTRYASCSVGSIIPGWTPHDVLMIVFPALLPTMVPRGPSSSPFVGVCGARPFSGRWYRLRCFLVSGSRESVSVGEKLVPIVSVFSLQSEATVQPVLCCFLDECAVACVGAFGRVGENVVRRRVGCGRTVFGLLV